MSVDEAEFTWLLEQTGSTRGNLSVQITKLKDAGYIEVTKSFKNNYPLTTCRMKPKGVKAFDGYVRNIEKLLNVKRKTD
jgi:DNA-binding MarR family transcriptional regulator